MAINPGASEVPHRQIASQLRAAIHRGDWGPGERLPSIPALAARFGVAKQTAQRTIDQLRVEGLLITRPGSGTFVRGSKRHLNRLARGRYGSRRGYHADLAGRYRQHLVNVGQEAAPSEVAEAFSVPSGTPLLVRRHLVRTADTPVEAGASWFRPSDVAGTSIERPDVFGRPLYQEFEEATGLRYASARDQITARLPTREEAETLQIRTDTPMLVLLHVAFDADHRAIEVAQAAWPGPVTSLTEEYQVPGPLPRLPDDEPEGAFG